MTQKCMLSTVNGNKIENADSFVYLGSEFTWDDDCSKDIRGRIGKVTGAFNQI